MASLLPLTFDGAFAGAFEAGADCFSGRPPLHSTTTPFSLPARIMVEPFGALTGYTALACARCGSSYLDQSVPCSKKARATATDRRWVALPLVAMMGCMLRRARCRALRGKGTTARSAMVQGT